MSLKSSLGSSKAALGEMRRSYAILVEEHDRLVPLVRCMAKTRQKLELSQSDGAVDRREVDDYKATLSLLKERERTLVNQVRHKDGEVGELRMQLDAALRRQTPDLKGGGGARTSGGPRTTAWLRRTRR
jgi:predicted  nucleic acid-binding Zn-ribbon protein